MDQMQARIFREAYGAAVTRYSKMTKAQLRDEDDAACQYAGIEHVFGGPVTKDELIADIMNLRGYTIAKWNEATHVIAHAETPWPDCPHCQAEQEDRHVCSRCGFPARLDADGRWIHESTADATFCALVMVPSGTGWPA